jgi:hypothetical protein
MPGVYALRADTWIEMQVAQAKKTKIRAAFPFHNSVTAVYPGKASALTLGNDVIFCASGMQPGTTFTLAKAKAGSKDRQVTVGTAGAMEADFAFGVDKKQAVELTQSKMGGNYELRASDLPVGEYMLFVRQGSTFSPPAFDFAVSSSRQDKP